MPYYISDTCATFENRTNGFGTFTLTSTVDSLKLFQHDTTTVSPV